MKANAPEKIYVYIPDDDIVGTASIQKGFPHQFVTEEYIRKDAFIEKSVNFLEMLGNGFTIIDNITHTNYDKEQLVKDFRNYMKGD